MPVSLLQNVSLVVLAGLAYGAVAWWGRRGSGWVRGPALGLLFGLVAFLMAQTPVVTPAGVNLDGRAGPMVFAGLLGGPLPAVIAASVGSLGRLLSGGDFAFVGAVAYFLYAGLGLAVRWRTGSARADDLGFGRLTLLVGGTVVVPLVVLVLFEWRNPSFVEALPPIIVANGGACLIMGLMLRWVTHAERTSRALEHAAERLQLASNAAGIGVWDFDPQASRVAWDETQRSLYGHEGPPQGVDAWVEMIHPDDRQHAAEATRAALAGEVEFDTEFRIVTPEGEVRHLRGCATVLRDAQGDPVRMVGVNYDVTPLRESERALRESQLQLAQSQKMEAIGRLSGGVAHDFNNLLSVVLGSLELLSEAELDHVQHEVLQDAFDAATRGGRLTAALLSFSRRAPLRPQVLDVDAVLEDTGRLLRRTLPATIAVRVLADARPWNVEVDRAQLESALLNLVLNGRDSLPDGGVIRLATETVELPDVTGVPQPHVRVTVRDDGQGMSDEVRRRAVEPFFTTKGVGEGSGMGLAMVQGFVRQSRGQLTIQSEEGVGTRVEMLFPATPAKAPTLAVSARRAPSGNERLLVVDDYAPVRQTIARQLRRLGYMVETAPGGDEALALLLEAEPFDLLLTDIVMPGRLDGTALAAEARALRPTMPVIFVSGYRDERVAQSVRPEDPLLNKPVTTHELAAVVRRCLELSSCAPSSEPAPLASTPP